MIGTVEVEVNKVAALDFAYGRVGQKYPLTTPEAEAEHTEQLGLHVVEFTKPNTAYCGDERPTIALADGTNDPDALRQIITPQLFGGIGLATAMALVAADAAVVKDAKDFKSAYETTVKLLGELGEEEAGHEGCGASLAVESSATTQIPFEYLVPSIGLFVPIAHEARDLISTNSTRRYNLAQSGYFSGWDPAWHTDFVSQRFPQNFSYLKTDPHDHETKGHYGSSFLAIGREGVGFAKNKFHEETGQMAFVNTVPKMLEMAYKLGGSNEERTRIALAFPDHALHVGAGIVTEGFPVFAAA